MMEGHRPPRDMNNPTTRNLVLATWMAVGAACGGSPEPPADPLAGRLETFETEGEAPAKVALLVGIDTYAPGTSSQFPNLRGCVNDTQRWADLLVESFGFEREEIFVMTDEEATHANIVDAFRRVLIERAGPETEAFFYFSGHGSQVPDQSGVELVEGDGFDSTFLAYDSRAGGFDGERDISDDELRCLVASLTAKTDRVTVVTDSCHSGGGLRGAGRAYPRRAPPGSRPLDLDWLRSFWPADIPFKEDGPGDHLGSSDYVHVAACRRDQLAYEFADDTVEGNERFHGALTYFLTHYLERAQPDQSWRSVVDNAAAHLSTHFISQTVTYSGALDRKLFDGDFDRVEGYLARATDGDGVLVYAGSMFGLMPGSVLEVRDAQGTRLLGEVEVEQLQGTTARCVWLERVPSDVPKGAMRAIETVRSGTQQPLEVLVRGAELRELAQTSAWLVVHEGESTDPEYLLEQLPDGSVRFETLEGIPAIEGGVIALSGEGEERLAALEAALREEVQWRAINRLGVNRGRYPLEVTFTSATAEQLEAKLKGPAEPVEVLGDEGVEVAGGALRVRGGHAGDELYQVGFLKVRNPYDIPLYGHVLSLSEDRLIEPIFPSQGNPPTQIQPGEEVETPIGILAPVTWSLDRPMRDRYVVIATKARADFSNFRSAPTMRSATPQPLGILDLAFEASVLRGRRADVDPNAWGVTHLDLLVEPPLPRE